MKQTEQIGTNRLTEGISFGFLSIPINSKTLPQVIVIWEDNANQNFVLDGFKLTERLHSTLDNRCQKLE